MSEQLEKTTKEMLDLDWEDIYAILVKMKMAFQGNAETARTSLRNSPQFLRALYQAQIEMGIAVFSSSEDNGETPK